MASSSTKDLMQEYHRLAADTLLGGESNKVALAILESAEGGQVKRIQKLLSEHRDMVDIHHPESGDTPLIIAARSGHREVVDVLLGYGADVTLENDSRDSVLDVAGKSLQKHILRSIGHEDRSMTNAKALLQAAWLGDAVSVKRCLSGSHYLDVNYCNKDGLTPLLLVTKDVAFFSEVQNAMETKYNPVDVLESLLLRHADVNQSDRYGYNPLHLIASSGPNIHATKMVSLLLQYGSETDPQTSLHHSPLHLASSRGHMTVIVALVEEGGVNINQPTSDTGDTPLMLSVRGGHNDAAHYLLSKGADVTVVTESGDSALTIANSPRMRRMIKEAWTEQSESDSRATTPPPSRDDNEDNERSSAVTSPLSPVKPDMVKRSFFLTDRQISQSLDFEAADLIVSEAAATAQLPRPHSQGLAGQTEVGAGISRDRSHDPGKREGEADVVSGKSPREGGKKMTRRVRSDTELTGDHVVGGQGVEESRRRKTQPFPSQPDTQSRQGGVAAGKRGRKVATKKTPLKGTTTRKKPLFLPTQPAHEVSRGHRTGLLPEVFIYSSPPFPKAHSTSFSVHESRLPAIPLKEMRAVKMVSVDTKRDNVRVHRLGSSLQPHPPPAATGSESPLQRSRSLIAPASEGVHRHKLEKKRNSTGSLHQSQPEEPSAAAENKKAVLQTRVVVPQLFGSPSSHFSPPRQTSTQSSSIKRLHPSTSLSPPRPQGHTASQIRPQGGQPRAQGNRINISFQPSGTSLEGRSGPLLPPPLPLQLRPTLSIVNEDPESLASSVQLGSEVTESDHALLSGRASSSEESTLRASSHSEFETDSLEDTTPLQATPPKSHAPSYTELTVSIQHSLPPTVAQFYQLTRQASVASHTPSSNTLTHTAVQDGSIPLSPIWNLDHTLSQSHSESSEYITSIVGATPTEATGSNSHMPMLAGLDSGQGESTDEERSAQPHSGSGSFSDNSDGGGGVQLDTHCLEWKKGRLLGKGAFGKVWEGLLESAKLIAVKEVELDITGQRAQSQYEKLRLEVEILRSLKHRNVVKYLGTSMDDCQVYIFMEFVSGGSVQSILKRFGSLKDKTSSHYTRQMVQALHYLHSNGIVHRDIKGANVMVTPRGVVKLIDFGSAKQVCQEVTGDLHSVRGTPNWMAPEVIRGDGYGRKSDIWSLGCTVHEMATSKPPWADYCPEAAIFQIGSGRQIPALPAHVSSNITKFIFKCIVTDPIKRPGADQLLTDSFLQKYKEKRSTAKK